MSESSLQDRVESFSAIAAAAFGTPARLERRAPWVRGHLQTQRLLLWYVLASIPVLLVGAWNLGDSELLWWQRLPAGLVWFVPAFAVSAGVGVVWELVFARVRHRRADACWLATAWLLALLLPVGTSLMLVALASSFAAVIGQQLFGGTGKYLVSPALLGALFLDFSYPDLAGSSMGSFGIVSALGCLLGGLVLVRVGAASWRVLLGALIGLGLTAALLDSGTSQTTPWYGHFIAGNFALALVFIATDPTTGSLTRPGRWMHGFMIGGLTALIRIADASHPDGTLFAILLAGLCVPLIDYLVVRLAARRLKSRVLARQATAGPNVESGT